MLERVWRKGNPLALLVGIKLIQPLWKTVMERLLKKLGIKPSYDPAIPLLGIYPEEIRIEKDTCTYEMFYINLTVNTWTVACQAPPSMGFSRNTGVGGHSLLQWIFPTQGSKQGLPHCRQILYHRGHQGSP